MLKENNINTEELKQLVNDYIGDLTEQEGPILAPDTIDTLYDMVMYADNLEKLGEHKQMLTKYTKGVRITVHPSGITVAYKGSGTNITFIDIQEWFHELSDEDEGSYALFKLPTGHYITMDKHDLLIYLDEMQRKKEGKL